MKTLLNILVILIFIPIVKLFLILLLALVIELKPEFF